MNMDNARKTFILEARELLGDMESALLDVERKGVSQDDIGAIFRAAHTIKGSSGLFGLDTIVSFTHVMENMLDKLREGSLPFATEMCALLLESGDHLGHMIERFEAGDDVPDPAPKTRLELLARLHAFMGADSTTTTARREKHSAQMSREPLESIVACGDPVVSENWHISLRLASDTLQYGLDPLSFFQYLEGLGKIVHLEAVHDSLPHFEEADPELLYLRFEIQFASDVDKKRIEDVFEFLDEGSKIVIIPPSSRIGQFVSLIHDEPDLVGRMGEILVASGALTPGELEKALAIQDASDGVKKIGAIVVEEQGVHPAVVAAALQKQDSARENMLSQSQRSIKVDVEKLDRLIDLVGELVIAGAGAKITAIRERSVSCEESVNAMTKLLEEIRDSALGLRMIPVGEVFNRFPRVVRDIARDLGKKIDLVVTGAETELDKSMVDRLVDPLMHVVRNAIDHGIEPVEVRLAAGKSATGKVHLHAYHESGNILIEVRDDGAGLNRERILRKAIDKGLVKPGQNLTDDEVFRLIFEAGFSTAEAVTNISGRGVGMDVVKRNIEQLRGEIDIESHAGEGMVLRIRVPLTLAIIDGFQVEVGNASYVVPLDLVKECMHLDSSCIHGGLVNLRGESLPLTRLRELFEIPGEKPVPEKVLVVQYGDRRIGLVVDQLVGELQAVIKPMGTMFREIKEIGGTTILGNGKVALLLDIPQLGMMAKSRSVSRA